MEPAQKHRVIDFRQQPPVKVAAPKEFKVRPKTRSKRTLFAVGIFVFLTVLLYSGLFPTVLPGWMQISLAVIHALSAAVAGYSVMRDLRRRPLPAHHDHDHHQLAPGHESATVKAAREQKEHLVHSLGHTHAQPRRKRRWGNIVTACIFFLVLGLWFTSVAPIQVAETEFDFAGQLNDAGTITTLILTEPSIAVPRPPRPMFQTITAARRIPLSRDNYQAGLQLITLGQYDEARAKLDVAKQADGLDAESLSNLELASAQSYLFAGKYSEAIKILKPLWDQQKNKLALAQMSVAALHNNQYREARKWAQQLAEIAKEPADKLRAMNLLLALDLLQWRSERNKHTTEARSLLKDSNDPHSASLQNNLGVLKTFAAPPQFTAAQGHFNAALDIWNDLDHANLAKNQHDPILAAAQQNIALCDWWAGNYESAYKQIQTAQKQRLAVRIEGDQKPLPSDQAVHSRGLLVACLCENTLGRWQLSRNTLQEATVAFRALPRTDPHRMACTLLDARVDIDLLRFDDAIASCKEMLKETTLYTPQHPLFIPTKLCLAEALLEKKRTSESRQVLAEVMSQLTSLRWNEYHPDLLIYYRLLTQLETAERNYPAAKAAVEQGDAVRKRLLAVPGITNQFRSHPDVAALLAARANWSFAQVGKENNPQNIALLNAALGDWIAAEKEMTAAIGETDAGSHPLNGRYVVMQGYMLYRLGRYAEAEARLRFWEHEFLEAMPSNHRWSVEALDTLVLILKAQNKDFKEVEKHASALRAT